MKVLKTFCYCKYICNHPNCGNRDRGEVVTVGGVAAVQRCIKEQQTMNRLKKESGGGYAKN